MSEMNSPEHLKYIEMPGCLWNTHKIRLKL